MARSSIGSVAVDFEANTVTFVRQLRDANEHLKRIDGGMGSLVGTVRKFGTGLAALGLGVSVTALASMGKQALDTAGGLGELSQQLGISTDFLQSLQYEAIQSGVEFGELRTGIQYLTRTIGDADAGVKSAVDTFARWGIAFEDLNGNARNTQDVLRDVADRMTGMETEAEKASLAVDFFSRTGQRLIPILDQGSVGLDRMTEAAKRAGVVLSKDMIETADRASDAMARLGLEWERTKQKVAIGAVEIADAVREMWGGFVEWTGADPFSPLMHQLDEFTEYWNEAVAEGDAVMAEHWLGRIEFVREQLRNLTTDIEMTGEAFNRMSGPDVFGTTPDTPDRTPGSGLPPPETTDDSDSGTTTDPAHVRVIENLQHEYDQLFRTSEAQELYNQLKAAAVDLHSEEGQRIAELVAGIQQQEEAVAALNEELDAEKALREEAARIIEETQTPMEEYEARVAHLNELHEAGLLPAINYYRAIEDAKEQLADAGDSVDETADALEKQQQEMEDAANAGRELGQEVANIAMNFDDLESVGKRVLQLLINYLMEMITTASETKSAIGSIIGGGGGGGGGFLGALFNGIGSLFGGMGGSGAVSGVPVPRASGGPVEAGNAYTVGEEGKELFVPGAPGSIVSRRDLAQMGGGPSYFIDARGADIGVEQRLRKVIMQLNASIEPRAVRSVIEARQRMGNFKAEFSR